MFTSADFIEALHRRGRKSLRPETPAGEFPPGWQGWFDAMAARIDAVSGAAAGGFVELLLEREPSLPPPSVGALTRWQAFATLWRQQWQAPAPEERRERVLAMAITLAVHLVLLVLLLWIAFVRFTATPAPRGEEVVQVEFIGRGTPENNGGAPAGGAKATAPAPQASRAMQRAAAARHRAGTATAAASPPRQPATEQPPSPTPATPPQPLQVSEVPQPNSDFVLPPPTPRTVEVPQLQAPALRVESRDVQVIEQARPLEAPRAQLPTAGLAAPALRPDIEPTLPEVQARSVEVPQLRAPELQAQQRDVPLREPSPATTAPAATPAPQTASATTPLAVT
ncbi:MAG: hypothetical protein HOQ02_01400, partial [Lysobacter sp.]|nr:hypothetical protein [Lysobacter sp.]